MPATLEKFLPGSNVHEVWSAVMSAHQLTYGSGQHSSLGSGTLAPSLGLRGPDYSKGPAPRKSDGELTLREGDLPELHVTCCFAKLNATLAVGKDLKLWLYLNDGVTEAKDLGPCELFGFGVGDFVECTDVPPKDTIGERLIFSLQSDADYTVEVQTVQGQDC